jgi:nicotinamide mononucleotide transporter
MIRLLEIAGVLSAILYLLLATRKSRLCWPLYVLSSVAYFPVFWSATLYADAWLQIYYVVMGILAWFEWQPDGGKDGPIKIESWSPRAIAAVLAFIVVVSAVLGYLLSHTSAGAYGYPDALVTVGSIVTTVLTARRVLQGWALWLGINILATGLYALKALDYTVGLYAVLAALSLRALLSWQRDFSTSERRGM